MKEAVHVSHEMTTFVGPGAIPATKAAADRVVFTFEGFGDGSTPILGYTAMPFLDGLEATPLVFTVEREACLRIFGFEPKAPARWHLSSPLRALALAVIDCEADGEARMTLRLARSIELLCQVHSALVRDELVEVAGDGVLNEDDVAKIANARRILDERWQEKLTIAEVSRLAGVNRDKLARGFRELYDSTIAEVLSERRLAEARRLLLATDLPVASVAYQCSYLNNASFTRAFARRFGLAPTELRRQGIAA